MVTTGYCKDSNATLLIISKCVHNIRVLIYIFPDKNSLKVNAQGPIKQECSVCSCVCVLKWPREKHKQVGPLAAKILLILIPAKFIFINLFLNLYVLFLKQATWLEGHSLAQTVFTNLYTHNPDIIEDRCLKAFTLAVLKMVDIIKDKVIRAGVFEEVSLVIIEDRQHTPIHNPTHRHTLPQFWRHRGFTRISHWQCSDGRNYQKLLELEDWKKLNCIKL